MEGFDNMKKKLRIRRWVKNTIAIICFFAIAYLFTHFILNSINKFDKVAQKCDESKGYVCSYYEARQFLIDNE